MGTLEYRIFPDGDGWWIEVEGVTYGPYATQLDAYKTAIPAAKNGGRERGAAEVVADARVVWTYGVDPFPLDYQGRLNQVLGS